MDDLEKDKVFPLFVYGQLELDYDYAWSWRFHYKKDVEKIKHLFASYLTKYVDKLTYGVVDTKRNITTHGEYPYDECLDVRYYNFTLYDDNNLYGVWADCEYYSSKYTHEHLLDIDDFVPQFEVFDDTKNTHNDIINELQSFFSSYNDDNSFNNMSSPQQMEFALANMTPLQAVMTILLYRPEIHVLFDRDY